MTKIEITDRIDLLITVQEWSKTNNTLTIGQRICISQERAALMRCLDYINEYERPSAEPGYTLPRHLNEKVLHLFGVIKGYGPL